jgi:hypothetical protein
MSLDNIYLQLVFTQNPYGMHMWSLNILDQLTWSQIHLWFLFPVVLMVTHVPWPHNSSDVELIQSSERCTQWTPYQPLVHTHLATQQNHSFFSRKQGIYTKNNCLHMMKYSTDNTDSLRVFGSNWTSTVWVTSDAYVASGICTIAICYQSSLEMRDPPYKALIWEQY